MLEASIGVRLNSHQPLMMFMVGLSFQLTHALHGLLPLLGYSCFHVALLLSQSHLGITQFNLLVSLHPHQGLPGLIHNNITNDGIISLTLLSLVQLVYQVTSGMPIFICSLDRLVLLVAGSLDRILSFDPKNLGPSAPI